MEQQATTGISRAVLTEKGVVKADNTVENSNDNRVLWALHSMSGNEGSVQDIVHSPICNGMTNQQITTILNKLMENGDVAKRAS